MKNQNVGFLHPGAMGVSLAACAGNSGCSPWWASAGRSAQTARRAAQHGLQDAGSVTAMCAKCQIIVSVCPPHAVAEVARIIIGCGFSGVFADVNAISPERSCSIGDELAAAGMRYVDGGVIGGPAWEPGTTLYLSGSDAREVAACFAAGPLETEILGPEIGKASALKMCYAANSKGGMALLCAIIAVAKSLGVLDELQRQWDQDQPGFSETTLQRMRRVTAKAWRFAGEMGEISDTFEAAGLPGQFHLAARDIYRRISSFKDAEDTPEAAEVINSLLDLSADSSLDSRQAPR